MKQKIATSLNVRVNVGNFQHIELTKYAEREIEYNTPEERIAGEESLNEAVQDDLIRTMRALPERLGKQTGAIQEVEEAIQKTIPKWLESNPEPNLAKKRQISVTADQKAKQDSELDFDGGAVVGEKTAQAEVSASPTNDEDLFGDTDTENNSNEDDLFKV